MPGVFLLGEVKKEERVDFEKESPGQRYMLQDGSVIEDKMEDELGLGIVTDKGLVVVGGCSHPGIVSMIEKAIDISGVTELYAVIGGFHLINASAQRIEQTITAFKNFGIKKTYSGHCTGLQAEARFLEEWNDDYGQLHSGTTITI